MSPRLLQPPLHPLPLHLPRGSGHIRCSPISTRIGGRPIPPSHWRPSFTITATAWSGVEEGPPPEVPVDNNDDGDAPTSIDLVPIVNEEQFDRIIAEAQQLDESVVVLWMANWCRKCIYLKPKLEKLAADYYPRIRFYCIDVNTVPQRLVNRAGITLNECYMPMTLWSLNAEDHGWSLIVILIQKMPTIQVWRDSQKQAEVIGGHKAWLVIDDVRRIIETED